MTLENESLNLHKKLRGKIRIEPKAKIRNAHDLAMLYTPGVAEASREIVRNPASVYDLTIKHNSVAIVSDGTRVLGLGDIGPEAALPVMEGKALIMKEFANIDAFPICLKTKNAEEIIKIVKALEPAFGAINLEDIETPKIFEIEKRLAQEMNIPVFHDDQHGTAMVALAALTNALKIAKKAKDMKVAIVGAGAAGYAIANLLSQAGFTRIIVFDRHGAISRSRNDLQEYKKELLQITNKENYSGELKDYRGADAIIAASSPGSLPLEAVKNMNAPKIVFALANPVPEISLEDAKKLGVEIYGSGKSGVPNQINNSLCFPGFLRALLDFRVKRITWEMKLAAAQAIAGCVSAKELKDGKIVPDVFNKKVVKKIVECVGKAV
jgi:malate dehydrogenase (oxaloacetate-decarboxylating)